MASAPSASRPQPCHYSRAWCRTVFPYRKFPRWTPRLLLFALGLTVITVMAFGITPAIRVCRSAGFSALREGVRTGGTGSHRARSALVIAEVVVSVVLLISSGLLIRALVEGASYQSWFRD